MKSRGDGGAARFKGTQPRSHGRVSARVASPPSPCGRGSHTDADLSTTQCPALPGLRVREGVGWDSWLCRAPDSGES